MQVPANVVRKNPRMVCEQAPDNRGKLSRRLCWIGLMRMAPGFLPKLFLPWNTRHNHGERAFRGLVHTMKKKIL